MNYFNLSDTTITKLRAIAQYAANEHTVPIELSRELFGHDDQIKYQFDMRSLADADLSSLPAGCGASACILGTGLMLYDRQRFQALCLRESTSVSWPKYPLEALAASLEIDYENIRPKRSLSLGLQDLCYDDHCLASIDCHNVVAVIEAFIAEGMDGVYDIIGDPPKPEDEDWNFDY